MASLRLRTAFVRDGEALLAADGQGIVVDELLQPDPSRSDGFNDIVHIRKQPAIIGQP